MMTVEEVTLLPEHNRDDVAEMVVNHLLVEEFWESQSDKAIAVRWEYSIGIPGKAICEIVYNYRLITDPEYENDKYPGYRTDVNCTPEHIAHMITSNKEFHKGGQLLCPLCEKTDLYQDNVPLLVLARKSLNEY